MPKPIFIPRVREKILVEGDYYEQMQTVSKVCRDNDVVFHQRGTLIRIKDDSINPLTATALQSVLIESTSPYELKTTKEGDVFEYRIEKYPREFCQHLIDRTSHEVGELEYVYRSPVYHSEWKIEVNYGYCPGAKAWIATRKLGALAKMDPDEAKMVIDDLLSEFCFADDVSRTHAVMALITPLIRPITGLTPLILITAPVHGSGKTYLAKLIGLIADGKESEPMTAPSDDDEFRKRITSTLMASPSVILLDNLNDLDSPSLASVLTSDTWSDRLLGSSTTVKVPNRAIWIATGNNPTVSGELARRTVLIRLVPTVEDPSKKTYKRDLMKYATENRTRILSALLTIVQTWLDYGAPQVDVAMGSYQPWASAAASIAHACGYMGALTNRNAVRSEDEADLHQLVSIWAQDASVRTNATPTDLVSICEDCDILGHLLTSSKEAYRARKVAKYVSDAQDRIIDGWRIQVGLAPNGKNRVFSLIKA